MIKTHSTGEAEQQSHKGMRFRIKTDLGLDASPGPGPTPLPVGPWASHFPSCGAQFHWLLNLAVKQGKFLGCLCRLSQSIHIKWLKASQPSRAAFPTVIIKNNKSKLYSQTLLKTRMSDSQNLEGQPKLRSGVEFIVLKALIVFKEHYQIHSFIHSPVYPKKDLSIWWVI